MGTFYLSMASAWGIQKIYENDPKNLKLSEQYPGIHPSPNKGTYVFSVFSSSWEVF